MKATWMCFPIGGAIGWCVFAAAGFAFPAFDSLSFLAGLATGGLSAGVGLIMGRAE